MNPDLGLCHSAKPSFEGPKTGEWAYVESLALMSVYIDGLVKEKTAILLGLVFRASLVFFLDFRSLPCEDDGGAASSLLTERWSFEKFFQMLTNIPLYAMDSSDDVPWKRTCFRS